jgi:hypothetical protein
MKVLLVLGLFLSWLMMGCSEQVPSKSEQAYLDTADSLRAYQSAPYLQKELAANEKARDLLKLDFENFKEKYDWNDDEVEVFTEIILGHVRIAKMMESFDLQAE